jgi:hypothetical protein
LLKGVQKITIGVRAWLGTVIALVNLGRIYPGRNFGEIYFAYKDGYLKQFKLETSGKLGHFKN